MVLALKSNFSYILGDGVTFAGVQWFCKLHVEITCNKLKHAVIFLEIIGRIKSVISNKLKKKLLNRKSLSS